MLLVTLVVAATSLALALTWLVFMVAQFVADPIVGTIKLQITDTGAFDQSRVLEGNPFDFLVQNSPAAKVQLTRDEIDSLLARKTVFNDCQNTGRECSTPAWGPPDVRLDFNGIEMPQDAQCVESYKSGSKARHDARVLCVDHSDNTVYYYSWDIDER